jgi:diacylglycerol kinase family enzyme
MKMAPKAKIDDGEIDLIIVKKTSSLTLFSVFPKLFDGSHIDHNACEYVHCKSFSIQPSEDGSLNIDGEIIGTTPVSVNIVKNGVELIV